MSMKYNWIVYRGLEELHSLKSLNDLKTFYHKSIDVLLPKSKIFYRHTRVPSILQIEPTNYCNVNCLCCPTPESKRKKGFMDINLFKKIVDDASQVGVKRIYLYLHGEPFLHPQIIEMISYIKSKGLNIYIATNGMLFNPERIEAILRSGINGDDLFRFSILGFSKEVHEKIMKGANHEKVLQNVSDFLDLRKKYGTKGPIIETFFLTTPENKHERNQFIEHWNKIADRVESWSASKSFWDSKMRKINTSDRKKTCYVLWERMTVHWNGNVSFCSQDVDGDYILGNLNKKSISEIWDSENYKSIKKLHKEKQFKKIPLCSKCDFSL